MTWYVRSDCIWEMGHITGLTLGTVTSFMSMAMSNILSRCWGMISLRSMHADQCTRKFAHSMIKSTTLKCRWCLRFATFSAVKIFGRSNAMYTNVQSSRKPSDLPSPGDASARFHAGQGGDMQISSGWYLPTQVNHQTSLIGVCKTTDGLGPNCGEACTASW